jgi:TraM recognition site of TraD and TraG
VIVNLNAFDVGEDTAALIGGTLVNLAARAIAGQANMPPDRRKPVTLVVDEFHTIPGADYEQVLAVLAKYGANVLLATQTLSRLDRLTDAQRTRNLRASVFSNLDSLFAFHTSAEDAAYLAEELGGGLDAQDLLELGYYQSYARLTDVRTGERLPTFSVQLEPPPARDDQLALRLARLSAEHYGRDPLDVELDLQSAMERIRGPQHVCESDRTDESAKQTESAASNTGTPAATALIAGAEVPGG